MILYLYDVSSIDMIGFRSFYLCFMGIFTMCHPDFVLYHDQTSISPNTYYLVVSIFTRIGIVYCFWVEGAFAYLLYFGDFGILIFLS